MLVSVAAMLLEGADAPGAKSPRCTVAQVHSRKVGEKSRWQRPLPGPPRAGPSRFEGELFDFDGLRRHAAAARPVRLPHRACASSGKARSPRSTRDFPAIEGPGNFAPERLSYGPSFAALLDTLVSPELAARFGTKFGVDLGGCHPTIAIRRHSEASDGNIHTDHKSKVITVLFYFNPRWPHAGGRLRLLRSATDMEDYAAESVPRVVPCWPSAAPTIAITASGPASASGASCSSATPRGGDAARLVSSLTKPIRRLLGKS